MGQKISAKAARLNLTKGWSSLWFAEGDQYSKQLHEDLKIRSYVKEKLKMAGLDRVEIIRSLNSIVVNAYVARPGVAIGRGGEGIDILKKELKKRVKGDIEVKINEVKKPELSAQVIARNIADAIEKRQSPKKIMAMEKEKAIQGGAKGIKIKIAGRIGGAEIARSITTHEGPVPLQTLKADIDYSEEIAATANAGLMGVKVWVYKGERAANAEVEK